MPGEGAPILGAEPEAIAAAALAEKKIQKCTFLLKSISPSVPLLPPHGPTYGSLYHGAWTTNDPPTCA